MATIRGSVTFRRYYVSGPAPDPYDEDFLGVIKVNRFKSLDKSTNLEESAGWITADHLYDTNFTEEKVIKGRYIVLGLRIDKRSVPSNVLGAQLALAIKEYLQQNKKYGISKHERQQLKEEVRRELLAKQPAKPSSYNVIWNAEKQEAYLFSTSDHVNGVFQLLFRETFGLELVPAYPYNLAQQFKLPRELAKNLSNIMEIELAPKGAGREVISEVRSTRQEARSAVPKQKQSEGPEETQPVEEGKE